MFRRHPPKKIIIAFNCLFHANARIERTYGTCSTIYFIWSATTADDSTHNQKHLLTGNTPLGPHFPVLSIDICFCAPKNIFTHNKVMYLMMTRMMDIFRSELSFALSELVVCMAATTEGIFAIAIPPSTSRTGPNMVIFV